MSVRTKRTKFPSTAVRSVSRLLSVRNLLKILAWAIVTMGCLMLFERVLFDYDIVKGEDKDISSDHHVKVAKKREDSDLSWKEQVAAMIRRSEAEFAKLEAELAEVEVTTGVFDRLPLQEREIRALKTSVIPEHSSKVLYESKSSREFSVKSKALSSSVEVASSFSNNNSVKSGGHDLLGEEGIVQREPSHRNQCPDHFRVRYRSVSDKNFDQSLNWCTQMKRTHRVQLGRSWGSLPPPERQRWDRLKCNELISLGKLQSCDERWGWRSFDIWRNHSVQIISSDAGSHSLDASDVKCAIDIKSSTFCRSKRVVVDFSKLGIAGPSRSFGTGFYTTFGERRSIVAKPEIPGKLHIGDQGRIYDERKECHEVETRPTFVISNDDIHNLGHYINDVALVWNMAVLANRDTKKSLLINIDGVRRGGPAGGPPHRLMIPSKPDTHGPYLPYYQSWFDEVRKGNDYGTKRVCFREIYFQPFPGVAWFWNDWGQISECSVHAPSPLYQSFNYFLLKRWEDEYGKQSLLSPEDYPMKGIVPGSNIIHVIIEVRSINKRKLNNHSSARFIKNLRELTDALSTIHDVKVTAQDFAKLNFMEQVKLSHSMGIFMSMHGAGTTHIFHSAVGRQNCCGLVELFPDTSIEFHSAHGYGNLARMHGFYHDRLVARSGSTTPTGTTVDVSAIVRLVEKQSLQIRERATCLHDIKDTTSPIYPSDF